MGLIYKKEGPTCQTVSREGNNGAFPIKTKLDLDYRIRRLQWRSWKIRSQQYIVL